MRRSDTGGHAHLALHCCKRVLDVFARYFCMYEDTGGVKYADDAGAVGSAKRVLVATEVETEHQRVGHDAVEQLVAVCSLALDGHPVSDGLQVSDRWCPLQGRLRLVAARPSSRVIGKHGGAVEMLVTFGRALGDRLQKAGWGSNGAVDVVAVNLRRG